MGLTENVKDLVLVLFILFLFQLKPAKITLLPFLSNDSI